MGTATAKDKKQASDAAYSNALETLRSYGVTSESAGLMKDLKDFAHPALLPYKAELEIKLREDGYKRVFFDKPKKLHTNEYKTIVLMGEDIQGVAWRLGDITIPKGQDEMIGKVELVQNYVSEERRGKKSPLVSEIKGKERTHTSRKESSPRETTGSKSSSAEEEKKGEGETRKEALRDLTVAKLKEILRKYEVKISGSKDELVERIMGVEFSA